MIRNFSTATLVLALASCAHTGTRGPQRQVGLEMIIPKSADQIRLKDKETFLLPSPIEADLPAYPDAIGAVPSVIVCAEIVVDTTGEVASVRQIDDADACEPVGSELAKEIMPSVADALRKWSFAAAAICRYETTEAECDDGNVGGTAQFTPTAVKLGYKIEFLRLDGVATVRKRPIDGK